VVRAGSVAAVKAATTSRLNRVKSHPSSSPSARPRCAGLTLVELIVALSVLVILVSLAVPSFQRQIAGSRLTSAANDLHAALTRARSEAIRTGSRATVCKSTSGTACSTVSSVDWNSGWIVFNDPTRTGSDAAVDTGETILARSTSITGHVRIVGSGDTAQYVSFGADGRTKLMAGTPQSGRIRVCSTSAALDNDSRARDVCVSSTGRVVVTQPAGVDATCPAPPSGACS
jgi:type IV fimbrial biogenesis protein FimT